ncbi:uncharacterized protein LOC106156126 [Lingula anatina]|uniref:Uncharacterized protein LOC106156126 n=1 Tax=Lingula anatina TaxID=7574 RepID=A0A1S3HNS9_LINAN|nr:uncharacterized protein LOC106156126 [Lingula anatina]|eukprot:XP_013386689.1 uncharacterized protein LOC106156126 [Lingula anatina]
MERTRIVLLTLISVLAVVPHTAHAQTVKIAAIPGLRVVSGSSFNLTCAVSNHNFTAGNQIYWKFNGEAVVDTQSHKIADKFKDRFGILNGNNVQILTRTEASTDDAGTYECELKDQDNSLGRDTISLQVADSFSSNAPPSTTKPSTTSKTSTSTPKTDRNISAASSIKNNGLWCALMTWTCFLMTLRKYM